MSKKWIYFEKGIALFLLLWGAFWFVANSIGLYETYVSFSNSPLIPDYAFQQIILGVHPILAIRLFTFISGLLLLISKRTGWLFAVATCFIYLIITVHSLLNQPYFFATTAILTPLLFILISGILLKITIAKKTITTLSHWLIILLITAVFLTDYLYFN